MVFLTIVNFFSFWGAELFMAPFFLLFLWGGGSQNFSFFGWRGWPLISPLPSADRLYSLINIEYYKYPSRCHQQTRRYKTWGLGIPPFDAPECTPLADHRNGGMWGWENSTGMPTPAKTTLNVLYKLTTEMWEWQGWENSTGMPTPQRWH